MSTGNFADWQGAMTDIGPMYPFVGIETVLAIVCFVAWIVWVVWQWRMESANYEDDIKTLKANGNMERAMKGEKVLRPM